MKVMFGTKKRHKRGVALLFALGILSMLLMLGLGFITNAILSQRVAANNSYRAQARTLARSALSRALTGINIYCEYGNYETNLTIPGLEYYYSHDLVKYYDGSDSKTKGNITSKVLNDTLLGENGKLTYTYDSALEDYKFFEPTVAQNGNDKIGWSFFYDDDSTYSTSDAAKDNQQIIGRAAWRVLPRNAYIDSTSKLVYDGSSQMSLYSVLHGAAPDIKEHEREVVPWKNRWGRGIEELNLNESTIFSKWEDSFGTWPKYNKENPGEAQDSPLNTPPYTFDMLFSAYNDLFKNTDAQDQTTTESLQISASKRAWIRRWFTEGYERTQKEAYAYKHSGKVLYNHRFNLGDYVAFGDSSNKDTDWYTRFGNGRPENDDSNGADVTDAEKNYAPQGSQRGILNMLGGTSYAFTENNVNDNCLPKYGLPILTRLGNDKRSFSSIEYLRKQIAANLNDYCDSDDVPTSDIATDSSNGYCAGWKIDDTSKYPNFTGNEKTLYINEFALTFDLPFTFKNGSDKFVDYNVKPVLKANAIKPCMWMELIKIYDDSCSTSGYTAEAGIANLRAFFSIQTAYKVSLSYDYFVGTERKTGKCEFTGKLGEKEIEVRINSGSQFKVDNFTTGSSTGYLLGHKELESGSTSMVYPGDSVITDLEAACLAAIKAQCSYPINEWKVEDVKIAAMNVKVTNFSVEFLPLMLKKDNKPVDFVRMHKDGVGDLTVNIVSSDTKYLAWNPNPKTGEKVYKPCFVLGGFEAKDPRQNLNPKKENNNTSDWTLNPVIIPVFVGVENYAAATSGMVNTSSLNSEVTNSPTNAPTMQVNADYNGENELFSCGFVNTESNPSAPKHNGTLIDETTRDTEQVTDPAYKNDAATGHLSTAVIRNAPMKSFWEIGAIHRAVAWQTLNTKKAGGFGEETKMTAEQLDFEPNWNSSTGTSYQNGDGAILDMVKLSGDCRSYGKLDINLLAGNGVSGTPYKQEYNSDLIKALFFNIRRDQTLCNFILSSTPTSLSDKTIASTTWETNADAGTLIPKSELDAVVSPFQTAAKSFANDKIALRSLFLNTNYGKSGDTFGLAAGDDDASQEEIIGKTIGLLTAGGTSIPNIFKILIVAQSIKDAGPYGKTAPITKVSSDGEEHTVACQKGVFNYYKISDDNYLYFDEITGEVKLLATVERDPVTGRMVIRQLEYIE